MFLDRQLTKYENNKIEKTIKKLQREKQLQRALSKRRAKNKVARKQRRINKLNS